MHIGSHQYFIEPIKGLSDVICEKGHPHLVYRRSALHQQRHQQPTDHVSMCGLEDRGRNTWFRLSLRKSLGLQ